MKVNQHLPNFIALGHYTPAFNSSAYRSEKFPLRPFLTPTAPRKAAWASMLPARRLEASSSPDGSTKSENNILTGCDIVKGGQVPLLLASDALGRIGLLHYPAELPETPAAIEAAIGEATNEQRGDGGG